MDRGLTLQLAFAGLHPDRVRTLTERYGVAGTVRRIVGGVIEVPDRIREAVGVAAADRFHELEVAGIEVTAPGDSDYPVSLARLPEAPPCLFVRGAIPPVPTVAIVGTRRCTRYGRELAYEYGAAMADAGRCVTSGLARGIDGAAHKGVVAAGGLGVGVLGCGIDVAYPPEHADLDTALCRGGGGVISEYPPGAPPEPWRFPPRNRIISGMAAAVVVVEAAVTGGALITAQYAMLQGRAVFAVPGDIRRERLGGM